MQKNNCYDISGGNVGGYKMKVVVRSIMITCIGAVVLLTIMTVTGRMNRATEIESNLSSVVEETVENMEANPYYTINNTEEFVADMAEYLVEALDSDSDLVIEMEKIDKDKGLLAVKVTEKFLHPNGNEGSVSCDRTVIFNRISEVEDVLYTVNFYLSQADALPYKTCRVLAGDTVSAPADPASETGNFIAWKDGNGYLADFTQPVVQDLSYYAEFN